MYLKDSERRGAYTFGVGFINFRSKNHWALRNMINCLPTVSELECLVRRSRRVQKEPKSTHGVLEALNRFEIAALVDALTLIEK
jgi:hypothetical protein